jgi:hypothetical protein
MALFDFDGLTFELNELLVGKVFFSDICAFECVIEALFILNLIFFLCFKIFLLEALFLCPFLSTILLLRFDLFLDLLFALLLSSTNEFSLCTSRRLLFLWLITFHNRGHLVVVGLADEIEAVFLFSRVRILPLYTKECLDFDMLILGDKDDICMDVDKTSE